MRVRKLLALTLAMVLVLSSFTFALGIDSSDPTAPAAPSTCSCDTPTIMKIDGPPVNDSYSDGTLIVTISDVNGKLDFDFVSNIDICGVFLKGGDKSYIYTETGGYQETTFPNSGNGKSNVGTLYEIKGDAFDDLMLGDTALGIKDKDISHVTFYYCEPEPPTGSITINKVVKGETIDPTVFEVDVVGDKGYTTTVAISEGNSVTLNDLALDTYTLTEKDNEDYIIDGPKTVTIDGNNLERDVTFNNELKTYEMSITKDASPTNLQLGGVITYTITVTNDGNQPLTDVTLTDDTVDLTETFDLAVDGEETFMVTQSAMTTGQIINVAEATDDMAGTVTASAIVNVTEEPTGSITFFKDVINEVDDPTSFMFHVSGPNNYGAYTQVLETDTDGVTLNNLPLGTYTFYEEVPEGYTGVTTSGSITLADVEGQLNQSFTFENTKDTQYGTLTIAKEVWIDGVEITDDDMEFNYYVEGDSATASGIFSVTTPGQVELPIGTYIVTESGYGDFTPDSVTKQAIVTTEGGLVNFVNSYTTPETGTLIFTKDVTYVEGRDSTMFNVTVTFPDQSTTQIAIQDQGTVTLSGLDFGEYSWVEEIPEGYEGVSNTTGTIWVGGESPNTRTVNIVNRRLDDGTYSITVYKEIIGTETDTEFEVAVYEWMLDIAVVENEEPPVYATTGTIIEGDPFVVSGLEPGMYWVSESPEIEGFYTPPDQSVEIVDKNEEVTITNYQYPEISIEKTVDDSSVYVNENVTYTITVTNLGGFYIHEVELIDEQLDLIETFELGIGESHTKTITTSYGSTGTKVNTATASATVAVIEGEGGLTSLNPEDEDFEGQVMDTFDLEVSDSATVNVDRRPTRDNTYRMTIDKVADGDFYEVGDTIEYTITVENTGNSTLTNVLVTDDMTGLSETIDFLSPGETEEFETTYVAQESDIGDLTNTATAEDDRAGTEEDDVTVTVEGVPEGVPGTYELEIEKTAVVEGDIFSGDMVEFTIVVTNTGDEILENILVEDDMVDFEAVIDQLEPGESEEFTVKVEAPNVPGPLTNTATATSEETGTLEADDTVFVEEPTPLDVPDTGVAPTDLFFGLGALVSGFGVFFTKKRK